MEKLILPFEVKNINSDDSQFYTVSGYASTFGNIDRGGDIIIRGAFSDALRENAKFPLLWQHDQKQPIGAFIGNEDEKGLFIEAKLPKGDSLVEDRVMKQLEVGSIKAFSIGYSIQDADFTEEGNRVLKKVRLWETSLVTIPMNPEAIVTGFKSFVSSIEKKEEKVDLEKEKKQALKESLRSIETLRECEAFLKELNLSCDDAKTFTAKFKKAIQLERDVKAEEKRDVSEFKELKDLLSNYINKNKG